MESEISELKSMKSCLNTHGSTSVNENSVTTVGDLDSDADTQSDDSDNLSDFLHHPTLNKKLPTS